MKRQFFSGLAGVSFVAIAIASPSISIAACAYSPSASGDAGLVYSADGQLHMFHSAYGSGNLIHAYGNPSNPGVFSLTLENLGGVAASTKPAVVSWGAGHVAAFVRRGDSGIYYYQIDNGVHSGWQALGGVKTYNPSAISLAPGHMIVFARGSVTTQGIWYREFNNGAWGGWVQLGGWVEQPIGGVMGSRARRGVLSGE